MEYKVCPLRVSKSLQPAFFTDAKCEDGLVVLGGWESLDPVGSARWFSITLSPEEAPYLFGEENRSQWASASAELLATLAAQYLFGHLEPAARLGHFPVVIPAVTDNRGNESLARKQSTSKWPLMLVNIQLSHLLMKAMLKLDLQRRPREENQDADSRMTLPIRGSRTLVHIRGFLVRLVSCL